MQIVYASTLILLGSIMIGLAYHNTIQDAWKVIIA